MKRIIIIFMSALLLTGCINQKPSVVIHMNENQHDTYTLTNEKVNQLYQWIHQVINNSTIITGVEKPERYSYQLTFHEDEDEIFELEGGYLFTLDQVYLIDDYETVIAEMKEYLNNDQ